MDFGEDSGSHVSVVPPANLEYHVYAKSYHAWASQYLSAAKGVVLDEKPSPVPYYLASLSLELGLKAFLLAKGWSIEAITKLNHNVAKALEKVEEAGLPDSLQVSQAERDTVQKACEWYYRVEQDKDRKHRWRYCDPLDWIGGAQELPDLSALVEFSSRLLVCIRAVCDEDAWVKITDSSGTRTLPLKA